MRDGGQLDVTEIDQRERLTVEGQTDIQTDNDGINTYTFD